MNLVRRPNPKCSCCKKAELRALNGATVCLICDAPGDITIESLGGMDSPLPGGDVNASEA